MNEFYNTIVNCHIDANKVHKQFLNASEKAKELIGEVQTLKFFTKDSRLREEILNYVIYCDYMLFKTALRWFLILLFLAVFLSITLILFFADLMFAIIFLPHFSLI